MVGLRIPTVQDNPDDMVRFMDELCNFYPGFKQLQENRTIVFGHVTMTSQKILNGIIIFDNLGSLFQTFIRNRQFTYPLNRIEKSRIKKIIWILKEVEREFVKSLRRHMLATRILTVTL